MSEDWYNTVSEINSHVDFIVNPNDKLFFPNSEQKEDMNKYPANEPDIKNLAELLKDIDEFEETKENLPINPGSLSWFLTRMC